MEQSNLTSSKLQSNLIVFGQRGSGKTLTARHLTRNEPRLLILDTFKEHDFGLVRTSYSDVIDDLEKPQFCIVFRDFEVGEDLKWIFHCVSERGDMCIYIEELSWYCKASWSIPYMRELLRNSRHSQVRFVATSQMPKQIDKELLGLCDCISGQLHEPNAIRYLKEISRGAEVCRDLHLPVIKDGRATVEMYDLMNEARFSLDIPL